ncbi:lamin tail domain-containing protein [bacterium]|nr:lamin tail domain-containing protein [bacterium]
MKNFLKPFKPIFILLLLLFSLIWLDQSVLAGETPNPVIINEVLFDPEGEDTGKEWIELFNVSANTVVLNNWKILIAGTTFQEQLTFSATIPAHSYFLICDVGVPNCNMPTPRLGLQNGGTATDAISIVTTEGVHVDQIFYDQPNSNSLWDFGNNMVPDNQTAIVGASGESLGRHEFTDTNNSYTDFLVYATPTPGAENIGGIAQEGLPQTGDSLFPLLIILLIGVISAILVRKYNLYILKYG